VTKAATPHNGIVCRTQQQRAHSSGANRLDNIVIEAKTTRKALESWKSNRSCSFEPEQT